MDYVTTVVCPNCNTEMELANTEEPLGKARSIIAKVYHFLEREYHTLKERYGDLDLSPLLKLRARTAEATGVSESTVGEILKEEKELKNPPQVKREGKLKRDRDVPDEIDRSQDSCSDDASLEESDDDYIPTENRNQQAEPDIETLVVKIETPDDEHYMEQADADSDTLTVHIEPPDDHIHNPKRTILLNDAGDITIQDEIKKEPEEYTLHESQNQGETSSMEFTTTVIQPNVNVISEISVLERDPIKIEHVELKEEGFS